MNGWERVDYVKPIPDFQESLGYRFNEVFDVVARDVSAVQTGCGICEVSGFNRFELTGSDTHNFLNRIICGRVIQEEGRVGLGYLLNAHGLLCALLALNFGCIFLVGARLTPCVWKKDICIGNQTF